MPQELNLNVSPYYDDFDRDNDYYRVLFKPGYPVQARELTTMQSILQTQVEKFGDHFFKEGKAVTGGEVQYYQKYPCVMIDDSFNGKSILEYSADLVDEIIVGKKSGIRARVDSYLPGSSSERGFDTYYITYLSANSGSSEFKGFTPGEELVTEDGFQTTNNLSDEFESEDPDSAIQENLENLIIFPAGSSFARCIEESPNEIGSAVHINEGVYYIRGHFVEAEEKTLLLDQYDDKPSYKVGLIVTEEITTYIEDDALLDNAQGFSNFTAPGADRLKIEIDLVAIDLDEDEDLENFIEVLTVQNGQLVNNNRSKQETENAKYVAERVDDIAGDFFVDQPEIEVVESLNDKEGNGGIYEPGQLTIQGQEPTDDMGVVQISPFKAYVNGFQVEIPTSTFLDFDKPRSTKLFKNEPVEYSTGPTLAINRVYGYPTLGIQTSFYITLRDERVGSTQNVASGKEIGVARVFDYELEDGSYNDNLNTNTWDLSLYDVRPYVEFELNAPVTLQTPVHIKGKATGASAHLRFDVSNSGIATAYEVKGRFNVGEKLIFNGIEDNQRVVKKATEFGLQKVKSIFGENSNGTKFSADTILEPSEDIPAPGLSVNITAASGSISTVSVADFNLDKVFDVGDIVSYTNPQNPEIPTFNKVTAVAVKNMRLEALTSVSGINVGTLPTSAMQASNFQKIEASIETSDDNTLYTELPRDMVAKVDLENSALVVRKTFNVTITNGQTNAIPAGDNFQFLNFNTSRYILTRDDGTIEELTDDKFKFTATNDQLTIKGLGSNTTGLLIATMQKSNNKSKVKIRNRIGSLIIDKSRVPQSGVGGTTLNDGLTYGRYPFGTRVQDEEICLLRPDVIEVLGIFESDNTQEPDVKRLEFNTFTGTSQSTADLIIGEKFEGANTEAIGTVIEKINDTTIGYIPANDDAFDEPGETVTFKESGVTAVFVKETGSDLNITSKFDLEDGFEDTIYDYARIVRNKDAKAPKRKLKIIYEFCTYDDADTGDITTVDSYKNFEYKDIPETEDLRHSDIIDIRPRVDFYNVAEGGRSPFEFFGRSFDGEGNSSEFILASDEILNLDYSIYLPRTDKVFLDETGAFHLVEGAPSENPAPPGDKDDAIEVATIILPAFLEDIEEASVELADNKRYTMDDIGDLEDRIKHLEYYTSLNLLEQSTANMKVTDGNGLNRFKSGFFVDDFSDAENQLKVTILKNSVDTEEGELRAAPYTTHIDLELGTFNALGIGTDVVDSTNLDAEFDTNIIGENIRQTGRMITLDYDEQIEIHQPYATQSVPVTTFADIFYAGEIELQPSTDAWVRQNLGGRRVSDLKGKYWFTKRQWRKRRWNPNWGWGGVTWRDWRNHWKGLKTKGGHRRGGEYSGKQARRRKRRRRRRLRAAGGDFRPKRGRKRLRKRIRVKRSGPKRKGWGKRTIKRRFWARRVRVGKRFVAVAIRKWMRMRNIQFKAKKMKPNCRVYAFFDNIPVMKTITPKLIEIKMVKGTFQVGERVTSARRRRRRRRGRIAIKVRKRRIKVRCVRGWKWASRFSGRVAAINHREGPFNQPTATYVNNPYTKTRMPTRYASNSTILNIDTFIMSLKQRGKYWGFVNNKMRLKGLKSKAVCKVVRKRLITDDNGTVAGSFFLPAADANRKRKFGYAFSAGEKMFRLIDSETNTDDQGEITTMAEEPFQCTGAEAKKVRIIRGHKCTRKPRSEVGRARFLRKCVKGEQAPIEPDPGEIDDFPFVDPTPEGQEVVGPTYEPHIDPPREVVEDVEPDDDDDDDDGGKGDRKKCRRKGKGKRKCKRRDVRVSPRGRPRVKTTKVKYVFDKKGNALPVQYVPYTIKSGKNKGKTKYLTFRQIMKLGGKKDARRAFREAGVALPPKKYPGRGKPARPLGGKKRSTSIAVKQNRKGVIRVIDTSKRARKLARKGKKSRILDVIRPGDKDYGYYNKGKPQIKKFGSTLIATQHRRATRKVTRRGRRKFEKRRFPVNKLPLKRGSIKRFRPPKPKRRRKRARPRPKPPRPTPRVNKRRRLSAGYPRRPRLRSRPKPPPRPPKPPRRRARRSGKRRGRRGKRSDFLLKTNIMIIRNALNRVIRM
tara:strand:+ start:23208 stop:29462 length:6255 start_codon:yes stop_codon:yes gene_type:complete